MKKETKNENIKEELKIYDDWYKSMISDTKEMTKLEYRETNACLWQPTSIYREDYDRYWDEIKKRNPDLKHVDTDKYIPKCVKYSPKPQYCELCGKELVREVRCPLLGKGYIIRWNCPDAATIQLKKHTKNRIIDSNSLWRGWRNN